MTDEALLAFGAAMTSESRVLTDAVWLAFRRLHETHEALYSVQVRCTELLLENRALRAELREAREMLPGWTCGECRGFNGEAKARLDRCRACSALRPAEYCAGGLIEPAVLR